MSKISHKYGASGRVNSTGRENPPKGMDSYLRNFTSKDLLEDTITELSLMGVYTHGIFSPLNSH
jgi:hypothetical protein